MTGTSFPTVAAVIILAFLSYSVVIGSPPPPPGHESIGRTVTAEIDTPAQYFSRGMFADDPAECDHSPSEAVGGIGKHHNEPSSYRTDTVEDFHRLAEGVNEHIRAEAAKLEECQRKVSTLEEVSTPHGCYI